MLESQQLDTLIEKVAVYIMQNGGTAVGSKHLHSGLRSAAMLY
jgi:hypothetical protein